MNKRFAPVALCLFVLASCTKDSGTINVSYIKAKAQYGNISDVRQMSLVEPSRAVQDAGKVFVGPNFILVGEEGKGIHVFDNTTPASPQNVLFMNLPYTREFYVEGNAVYAESQYDLVKVDISSVTAPFIVQRVEYAFADQILNDKGETLLGFAHEQVNESLAIGSEAMRQVEEDGFVYLNYQNQLIPSSAVPASFAGNGQTSGSINRITYKNGRVYVIGLSRLYTFSDVGGMLSKSNEIDHGMNMETIYPDNGHLYIGTRTSVEIFKTTDPDAPEYVSTFQHEESCDPVYPYGDVAFSTLRTGDATFCPGNVNALIVLDITDRTNPRLVEQIEMDSPYGLTISDNLLYLGEGANGLRVFDVSDPLNPQQVRHDMTVPAYDVIMHPTIPHLVLTTGPNGVVQYEQDPATLNLSLVSTILF